jgi:nicotinamide-nucleotide amidase
MTDHDELPAVSSASIPLELQLNQLLVGNTRLRISAAESCTGGEIAHRIVSIAGSSDYFQGSAVTYSNGAKTALLGVSTQMLESVGAVSPECARAMAEGSRRIFDADVAVSTTGIAGPGGATARKPVGLVYIGLTTRHGSDVEEHHFTGDRTAVINQAAERALALVVDAVHKEIAAW